MQGVTVTVKPEAIEALIRRAQRGERSALEELAEAYRARLQTWIRSRIGERLRCRVDAEDIVQETYLRAFQSLDRFVWRHPDSFFQWLATIARHLLWNASQKRSTSEMRLTIDPPRSEDSPSKNLRRHERFDRLERAFLELRPDERKVVRLARIEGLKMRDIAARLGRPEPTVRSLLVRALRKLKESLGDTRSLHLPDRTLETGSSDDV